MIEVSNNIVEKINLGEAGIIDKKLVLYKKNTLYTQLGDSIFYALLLVLTSVLIKINFKYGLKNKI